VETTYTRLRAAGPEVGQTTPIPTVACTTCSHARSNKTLSLGRVYTCNDIDRQHSRREKDIQGRLRRGTPVKKIEGPSRKFFIARQGQVPRLHEIREQAKLLKVPDAPQTAGLGVPR
jgi:hypothetical protein